MTVMRLSLPPPKARTRILWAVIVADLLLLGVAYTFARAGRSPGLWGGISAAATVSLVASLVSLPRNRQDGGGQ